MIKSSVTASILNTRPIVICYHRVRKAQAAGTLRVVLIPGEYNLAHLLTRNKMKGNIRHVMIELIFYNKVVVIRKKDES